MKSPFVPFDRADRESLMTRGGYPAVHARSLEFVGLSSRSESGLALVVTLALIVLVTVAAVAFLSRATVTRTIEASRSSQVLVGQLSRTALDYVAAQFIGEIAAHSTSNGTSGTPVYQTTEARYAVPQRALPSGEPFDSADFFNLVRLSGNATLNGVGESNASSHSTATPSRNGRFLSPARWNAPILLGGAGFSDNADLPYWIYVNKDGSATATPSANAIGRFAYTAYNIGGLLDANVAGHPANVTNDDLSDVKDTLAGADLTRIPGITSPDPFTAWRNGTSVTTPGTYVANIREFAQTGFLRPPTGNQIFAGRQDLIRLARSGTIGLAPASLPFLTTFSRALTAPSWTPPLNASAMGTNFESALRSQTLNYADDANAPASVNRNIPNVRVTTAFTRRDGSEAKVGAPLLSRRFPLEKLALVVDGATDADISAYFGLTWNGTGWNYRSPTIMTLAQVAAAGREPDFFELLKAGILSGSLGKATGGNTAVVGQGTDLIPDLQILAIGANLIDQADANDRPTVILRPAANETVFGIENHPYIYMMSVTPFRRQDRDYNPANVLNPRPWVTSYQQMQVWNPHLNASATGRNYRIRATQGQTRVGVQVGRPTITETRYSTAVSQTGRFIAFSGNLSFAEPTLLNSDRISDCSPENRVPGAKVIGFHHGDVRADNNTDGDGNNYNDYFGVFGSFDAAVVYDLEVQDGTVWTPIQRIYPLNASMWSGVDATPTNDIYDRQQQNMHLVWGRPGGDPRVRRFGFNAQFVPTALNDNTSRRNISAPIKFQEANLVGPGWKDPGSEFSPDMLMENRRNTDFYVADPDGVVRPGDGAFPLTNATNIAGLGSQARAVMLNRPFTSVGEMGYAHRGDPWKSLDLASASSADSALLDLFSVEVAPDIQAGLLNPNTAPAEVLAALLPGSRIDPGVSTASLSNAEALSLSSDLANRLQLTPLQNPADLARMVEELGNVLSPVHKRQREVLVRALADVSNTRTWNLLVDVVAQVGSFPASSTAFAAGDFTVQGEQRRWVSMAIDRPTGRVINQSTEFPSE